MKFKVRNINYYIYYKYLSLLVCDRSYGIFEKIDQLSWKIRFTFNNMFLKLNLRNLIEFFI